MSYGNPSYWDERYAKDPSPFDWYMTYADLRPLVRPRILDAMDGAGLAVSDVECLVPGCGSSDLPRSLHDEGFTNVTSLDISSVVVKQMSDRHDDLEELEFCCMDASNLDILPEAAFHLIFDKGLLDALLCSEDSQKQAVQYLREMDRVLAPGGVFVCVSHGVPTARFHYFGVESSNPNPGEGVFLESRSHDWRVEHMQIRKPDVDLNLGDSSFFHVYVMKKQRR